MNQSLMNAAIIGASSSTKNQAGERDAPDRKGNLWRFGMKVCIGADARTGRAHSLEATATNEHNLQ